MERRGELVRRVPPIERARTKRRPAGWFIKLLFLMRDGKFAALVDDRAGESLAAARERVRQSRAAFDSDGRNLDAIPYSQVDARLKKLNHTDRQQVRQWVLDHADERVVRELQAKRVDDDVWDAIRRGMWTLGHLSDE